MTKHPAVEMSGDLHDGFVAGATFGQFCDEGVAVIVPSTFYLAFSRVVLQAFLNEVM